MRGKLIDLMMAFAYILQVSFFFFHNPKRMRNNLVICGKYSDSYKCARRFTLIPTFNRDYELIYKITQVVKIHLHKFGSKMSLNTI